MMRLIQFPWSPFCLVQKRILEYAGARFKLVNILPSDRSLPWKLSKERYYQLPVLEDGGHAIFEMNERSQVIAKYVDTELGLNLFPLEWDGVQKVIWQHIENDVEGYTFKLNDAFYRDFLPKNEQLPYIRHKERKFGAGCLDRWRIERRTVQRELECALVPYEQMLWHRNFLLTERPLFVDFDLWGMLANYLYTGRYRLPAGLPGLKKWHARMTKIKRAEVDREKLHP